MFLLGDYVSLAITFFVLLTIYLRWRFQYWSSRGIPFLHSPIAAGNLLKVVFGREHIGVALKKIYNIMKKKNWKCGGILHFTESTIILTDLDIIRNVLIKDFQHFVDRGLYYNKKDALQTHILNLSGNEWKRMRVKLTSLFTPEKIKLMFRLMRETQKELLKRLEKDRQKAGSINITEISACFMVNIISFALIGLKVNALGDNSFEFRTAGKKLFKLFDQTRTKVVFGMTFPDLARILQISLIKKELTDFVTNIVQRTIEYRDKNNVEKNDFIQMMINLKNNKPIDPDDQPLNLEDIASQCVVFFAAGFEMSSTLLTFALYELARNQHAQDELRNEIKAVLEQHQGEVNYDSIQAMTYLNQVTDEILRMHPPTTTIFRKCVKDYNIPNEKAIIKKGTNVAIPILGIHYDEDIYPNPTAFDPERFTKENRKERHNCAHLPFSEGPRKCLGMRFGLLQSKLGLISLIKHYKFTVDGKTQEPIVYEPKHFVLFAQNEIWLRAQKL